MFDAEAAARHEAACKRAVAAVMEQCDPRARETVSIDGHVGCVFERQVLGQGLDGCRRWGGWGGMLAVGPAVGLAALTSALRALPHCRSPYCHAVVRGHVCAVFAGEIAGAAAGTSAAGLHALCQPEALRASQAAAHRALCPSPLQPGRGTTRLRSTTMPLYGASHCLWRTMPPGWCRYKTNWEKRVSQQAGHGRQERHSSGCVQLGHMLYTSVFVCYHPATPAVLRQLQRPRIDGRCHRGRAACPEPGAGQPPTLCTAELLCLHACYPCSWASFQPLRRGPALLPLNLPLLQGSFAFVLFDSLTKRVWAARDAEGVQPLFWGVTGECRLELCSLAASWPAWVVAGALSVRYGLRLGAAANSLPLFILQMTTASCLARTQTSWMVRLKGRAAGCVQC